MGPDLRRVGGVIRWLYYRIGKRLFDMALAGLGLVIFSIPLVWIAWAICRESGRPVFFRQTRIGRWGENFLIMKFRTMTPTGEVLHLGERLRATAMDELPQLFHILKGQMSFVGPRPLIPEELEELRQIPNGDRRLSVRPGLTGLAQLYGTKVPALAERVKWDIEYVDRCSLRLDLWILLKSVGVTLKGAWERPGSKMDKES